MLQAKQIPAPEPATPTVATRRSGWRAPARRPARRTNCRVGGGAGPEDAPGAGGHHEAGEVGHGECVDVGGGEDRDVLWRLRVDRLRRVELQGLSRKRD